MSQSIDTSLLALDLCAQLSLIGQGELNASDIVEQQLALINQVDSHTNAFITLNDACASQAFEGDSPLKGLSIAVKDNIDVLGFNTTAGLETRRHSAAQQDAFVCQQLRKAGGRFIGKLNMHEGALGASNHNSHYGNAYNPFDFDKTPGGSSGGSGIAVAAGYASLVLGSDTMGSVRIPASYCGVFGFKASRGLISNAGSVTCSRLMDTIGPMARSARDLSLAFNIMQGFNPVDGSAVNAKLTDALAPSKILLIPDNLVELGVDSDIIEDFERNIIAFIDLGFTIKRFTFDDYDFGACRRAGLLLCEADMRVEHADDWQNHRDKFSPYLQSLLAYIDRKSPMDMMHSERVLEQAKVYANALFEQGDYLLMPTTPQRAFSMADEVPANQADLTSFANQAGLCALSMPMITSHQLPAGMQLVGNWGSDLQILHVAELWQSYTQFSATIPDAVTRLISSN